jgi:four helix bundle protein
MTADLKQSSSGFHDLIVYRKAYEAAMSVYHVSKTFPAEEKFSLTDQIRRCSRSVCANISESYRKRIYPKSFVSKISDADAECTETLVFLCFARDCDYISGETFHSLEKSYLEIGRLLGAMIAHPEKFCIPHPSEIASTK